jgi:RNA polymerase sigma-70 factor (ECF subfamily)
MKAQSEEELIRLCKSGERGAFSELFHRYHKLIASVIWRMIPDKNDVQDVLQDVFLQVINGIRNFQGRCRISTWLYRIAFNECCGYLDRKKTMRKHVDNSGQVTEAIELIPGNEPDPLRTLENREINGLVAQAIDGLDHEKRLVMHLFYYSEMPIKKIAELLKLPMGTTSSRITRAKEDIIMFLKENTVNGLH